MSTKKITQNIVNDESLRRRIFKVLCGSLLSLSLCYVYLVGSITFNIIARKTLETNINELNSEVGQLELQSIQLVNNIDVSFGKSMGYVEAHDTLFVNKDQAVALR